MLLPTIVAGLFLSHSWPTSSVVTVIRMMRMGVSWAYRKYLDTCMEITSHVDSSNKNILHYYLKNFMLSFML